MPEITILILAAGASARMGGADKLLHLVDGAAQLRRVALAALATGCPVVVTLPPGDGPRRAVLQGLPVRSVPVLAAREGMAASIRAGAAACATGSALMILPADMPDLDTEDLSALIAAHQTMPTAILRGADRGLAGHPVVIPADLVADLQGISGDAGARGLIASHPGRLRLIALSPGHATLDLDTPQDWAAWHAMRAPRPAGFPDTTAAFQEHPSMRDPLEEARHAADQVVLAVITGVTGASYRNPGAMMALFADGRTAGNLTNGCIEGDLAIHAGQCLASGQVGQLRYGAGSDFFDIRLPCGGGLQISLFPRPDAAVLEAVHRRRAGRGFFSLRFEAQGALSLGEPQPTGWQSGDFLIDVRPPVRFAIFGDGPEAVVFTRLVHASGYEHHLVTGARDTFEAVQRSGSNADYQQDARAPDPAGFDARTAVVTFFHDHDQEIAIIAASLHSAAFYVGAQGSRKVAERQRARLQARGFSDAQMARFRSPIGLIPSARDPRTLAISVLAEIIKLAADVG